MGGSNAGNRGIAPRCALCCFAELLKMSSHIAMLDQRLSQVYSDLQKGESPVKAVRSALDLSQVQFAARLGVAVSTVSRWENGQSPITLTLKQIKVLEAMLYDLGLTFRSLPDDDVKS